MPIYTCTTIESTLSADTKKALADEIGAIHSAINQAPSTYVNVVFHELRADSVYTDGVPAQSSQRGDQCSGTAAELTLVKESNP